MEKTSEIEEMVMEVFAEYARLSDEGFVGDYLSRDDDAPEEPLIRLYVSPQVLKECDLDEYTIY